MDNKPITGGSILKLQKPNEETYVNVVSKGGKQFGDCTICNCDNVEIEDHICKTFIDSDKLNTVNIYDTDPMITNIDEFKAKLARKKLISESSELITYNDGQIEYFKKAFSMQNIKYRTNRFFASIMAQLETKRKLSKAQEEQLKYLLKHGKTMYENGYLTTKN